MSSHKSHFLQMEHARVTELECKLESTHRESQDWAVEVNEAWAAELLIAECVTIAELGLEAVKARQAETEAAL